MIWNFCYKHAISKLHRANLSYSQGTASAQEEALWLVCWVCKIPFSKFSQQIWEPASKPKVSLFESLLKRRVKSQMPMAYILKEAWYCNQRFKVDKRVLIPRSPIGELLQNNIIKVKLGRAPNKILEIGTGSACLAIIASHVFRQASITAVDINHSTLALAKQNVALHRVSKRISLGISDCFTGVKPGKYDLIISNPPYVSTREFKKLPKCHYFEPQEALLSQGDDLRVVSKIISSAKNYMADDGLLILEVGNRIKDVKRLFPTLQFDAAPLGNGGEGVLLITTKMLK